jgi:histidinol-phosphate aminotransferase
MELNRNELSFPPPEHVVEAACKGLERLNRYATADEVGELKNALAAYCGVAESSLLVTSGVEILLGQLIQFFARRGEIAIIDPTFFIITRVAESLHTSLTKLRLTRPSLELPMEPLMDIAKDAALVVIDNPNNPTGKLLLDREATAKLCERSGGAVLVDESYYEFAGLSVIDMVKDHDNLIVARTMSKAFALAGLKVGYMVAGDDVLKGLSSLEVALRPTTPSVYAAVAALGDTGYVKKNVSEVSRERERVAKKASEMGVEIFPSTTNFLLMRTDQLNAAIKLREQGVLVFDPSRQFSSLYIRVSIGTHEENDAFLSALKEVLVME